MPLMVKVQCMWDGALKVNSRIDCTNVLVAILKLLYIAHYGHVGSGLYPFKLPDSLFFYVSLN